MMDGSPFGFRASNFELSPLWDALVIGAGPAGAVTARELARRGRRVLLVDKAAFPRAKVCGCCLNGAAVATLERLGLGHVLAGAVPLNRVNIAAGSRNANVSLTRAVALSRDVFDARLIAAAVEAGVEFRPNTMIPVSRDLKGSEFNAKVVIVASGLTGGDAVPVAGSRIGGGVVLANDRAAAYGRGTIHMATSQHGYVGLVRVEDDRLDIAAAFDPAFVKSTGGLGPAAETILREVSWPVPAGMSVSPWKGTPALTRRPTKIAGPNYFLVGDAAGYVEPFTGEGMAWAVMSAAALAPLAAQDWHPGLIRQWEATHQRVIARRQQVCRVASRVLRSPLLTNVVVRVLEVLPKLADPVVFRLNRPDTLWPAVPT